MRSFVRSDLLTETIMNNKKSPGLLRELAQEKICNMILVQRVTWVVRLRLAESFEWRQRLLVIQDVLKHCFHLRQVLVSLPDSTCRQLSEHVVRAVGDMIETHDIAGHSRPDVMNCRRLYEEVCLSMLRAFFLPCIQDCNMEEIKSEFVQELISKSIQTNPNITRLILPPDPSVQVPLFVVRSLCKLTLLQEFRFEFSCTAAIVKELGTHCTLLKILNVGSSQLVNDDCLEYLLKLQTLEKLQVGGTKISEVCYAMLLTGLPRIQNIYWRRPVETVLRYIIVECLPLVTEFSATVTDVSLLTQKCPRIKNLSINLEAENSCELVHLTDIVSIEFTYCDYKIKKLTPVLENLGMRLEKLDLFGVKNIDFIQIVRCCSALNILMFRYCQVILPKIAVFNPTLPHFKSVKTITLQSNPDFKYFHKQLHLYVNLEVFTAEWVEELDDVTVSEVLYYGGFRNLSTIVFNHCGHLSLQTAMLLLEDCDCLSVLGNVSTWSGVSCDDQKELFNCVKTNNLALTIKC